MVRRSTQRLAELVGIVLLAFVACACGPRAQSSISPSTLGPETPVPAETPGSAEGPSADGGGGKVAYVLNGDVWIKALPSGAAKRLTDDGLSTDPLWSPSGRYVAFRRDIELRTIDTASGRMRAWACPVSEFAWSPVDDRLAYVAGSGILRLMVADAAGSGELALIPPEVGVKGWIGRIAWRPDGEWVAYEWHEGNYRGLWMIPASGGAAVELYASGVPEKGEAVLAGWSRDGRHLLFWQGDSVSASLLADGVPLYASPAGGGEPVALADAVLLHKDFIAAAPTNSGSPLALVEGAGRGTWNNKVLRVVDVDTGLVVVSSPRGHVVSSPAWSPDGMRIAYASMPDEGNLIGGDTAREGLNRRRIWLIDLDDPEPVCLTDDPAYRDERPNWSADGTGVLFARMDAEARASLWWLDLFGGQPVRVVDEIGPLPGPAEPWFGYYGHVAWETVFDWWNRSMSVSESMAGGAL